MGEKLPRILPKVATFVFFYMPKIYDMVPTALFPSEGGEVKLRIISPENSDGLHRVWTREIGYQKPPKPLKSLLVMHIIFCHVTENKFGSLSQQISNYN